jgi:hypothetical protein
MPKIPRILLDKELMNSIKPLNGTLSFSTLDPEMINILSNLYNYFIPLDKDAELFTLVRLFQICCPNEQLVDENGKRLTWKLYRFKDLIVKYSTLVYSYPVLGNDGKPALISEQLYTLKRITKIDDETVQEYFKIITDGDERYKTLYGVRISQDIKREFMKHTQVDPDKKGRGGYKTNYIDSEIKRLDDSRGRKASKMRKIQQVINEEISIKKLRIKKKQPVEMVSEFEIVEFATKMGDLKRLRKDRSRYLVSLEDCLNSVIDSTYPISAYELVNNKKIRIVFDKL